MTWYAIRTTPGSQKPQREFAVEKTRSRKGYRIIPSLDPKRSAIEKALSDCGFRFYMPAEHRLVRDRRRPYIWTTRRFALMVGYVFVDAADWRDILAVPGVVGLVADAEGRPLPIDFLDLLRVFEVEMRAAQDFKDESRKARQTLRKMAKKDPSLQRIVDSLDIAGTISVSVNDELLVA